ncbi:MAG TPA: hypothetical protein VHT92_09075, partial [Candidatus Cybelea sp.]|nr:hypothetical protein [Candidatus Cybelea sp.]
KKHPPVRKLYADQLIEAGVVSRSEANRMVTDAQEKMTQAHDALKQSIQWSKGARALCRPIHRTALPRSTASRPCRS